ncbi:hypothetical protein HJD18_13935 [Thermoleophilia bacterium SCSIO 60948]|nr:hypothetical protein HJD18_13935 [Thermoleophilia bacterium SCSIO 60948]
MNRLGRAFAVAIAAAALAAAATLVLRPEPESLLSADAFVAVANEAGAGIELGPRLASSEAETEIHTVGFTDAVGADSIAPGSDLAHGAASLIVSPSAEAAGEQYERCDTAITIRCYLTANVVLLVDSPTADEVARLDTALATVDEG